jgi:hypothetical protein
MKARLFAVFTILALVAWAPVQAQQAQAPTTTDDAGKSAKHTCCASKTDAAQGTSAEACCHGKASDAKASCCEGKDKEMACCSKKAEGSMSAANCCKDMKDGQCSKDGKSCCEKMNASNQKGCCAGIHDQCPIHASGK